MRVAELLALSEQIFLKQIYRTVLGREPDDSGFLYYVNALRSGRSKLGVLCDIYRSKEAQSLRELADLRDLPDEAYIDAVYHRLLARPPDHTGKQHYLNLVRKGKRKNIVLDIKASQEYKQRQIDHMAFDHEMEMLLFSGSNNFIMRLLSCNSITQGRQLVDANEWTAQIETLARMRDEHMRISAERAGQINALSKAKTTLEQENEELLHQHLSLQEQMEQQLIDVGDRNAEIEALNLTEAELQRDNATLTEQIATQIRRQAEERAAQIETLDRMRDEHMRISAERAGQINALSKANMAFERDLKTTTNEFRKLRTELDGYRKGFKQRNSEIQALSKAKTLIEKEKIALAERIGTQTRLSEERATAIAALAHEKEKLVILSQERLAKIEQLTHTQASTEEMLAKKNKEYQRAITQLEQERSVLAGRLADAEECATDYRVELSELKQLGEQECARVDDQFKMIRDILLSEALP